MHRTAPLCILMAVGCTAAWSQATDSTALEPVNISVGRGQLRSIQGLGKFDFDNAISGTSPLATVASLPGVNFQSADPLGNYEWSARFSVRAFGQNQLGFTLDDVPLGDMSYSNFNGLHISRAISSENVARAFLSQGSGALETASSSNLGGTLQFYSSNPRKALGVDVRETFGSQKNRRHFVRLDTGDTPLGQFFVSYTGQSADKWKGTGTQKQEQWNLKGVTTWGDNRLSAFVNTSKRREIDYQDMSLEMIDRLGTGWDNFYLDFGAAVKASNTLCGNGGSTYVAQCDDAYYAGSGLRDDVLGGATLETPLSEQLRLKTTLYSHSNTGAGLWYTPYTPSPDGTPLSVRTTEYGIRRTGIIANLEYQLQQHQIKLGYWHENNTFQPARRFYATSPTVLSDPTVFPSNPFFTQWQYRFKLKTDQISVSDTYTPTPALTLGAGFKALRVSIDGQLEVGTDRPSGTIVTQDNFLPQIGAIYQLNATDELFASLARNMRSFQGTATGTTPYATTAAGFAAIRDKLKPETSQSLEAGWRTQGPRYQGTLTAYHVMFQDRLLGVQLGAGIQGNPTGLSNVGRVRTLGLEAALAVRLTPSIQWYSSLSQSQSTYQDDVVSGTSVSRTAGKRVVDAPDTLLKSIVSYESGPLFASVGMDAMSERYYTYLNDGVVPARTLFNLSVGYRAKSWGALTDFSLQGGLSNLTDQRYIATVGSNGFTDTDPARTGQTLLPGAPRQVFVTIAGRF